MAQPEKRENSVLFSLRELRQIEENRVAEEEHAVKTAQEQARAAKEQAERMRREAEEAKVREERDVALAIETARENAEREARMRVESHEATERQRQQAALEQQRLQQEMELRRADIAKKRPTWMLAVTGIAIVVVVIFAVLVYKFSGESDTDKKARVDAEIAQKKAEDAADEAAKKVESLKKDVDAIDKAMTEATNTLMAAQTQADRDSANAKLRALQIQQAKIKQAAADAEAAAKLAKRKAGLQIRQECKDNPLAKGCQ